MCNSKQDADKRVSIVSLPEVLCIHLKRFSYSGWGSKNTTRVAFPLNGLDMSPFLQNSGHRAAVRSYVCAKEQQVGMRLTQYVLSAALRGTPVATPTAASSFKRVRVTESSKSKRTLA
ncbi:MAG: hypothetical protein EOO41_05050 [Methanobacteriota archaeon]|nr:MAG: hypothetical protein EOO41_05050 [Euryarchaeota archaeon]